MKKLWVKEGEVSNIEGISIGKNELTRLLHFRGVNAYINDNIVDGLCNLLNPQEGDSWIFPSHTYEKVMRNESVVRWVTKAKKRWDKKWGKNHIPRHILVPFAVGLHCRLIVWDTNRDRVAYIDPFNPNPATPEDCWVDAAVKICIQIRAGWCSHDLPGPSYGLELPELPVQRDGVSCGLYVIVYTLMIINGWVRVLFPLREPTFSGLLLQDV